MARATDPELERLSAALPHAVPIGDRGELESLLGRISAGGTGVTLDLVGHTTADKLLALGDWVIDGGDRTVVAYFRELAEHDVLQRLGVRSLRLIGSLTGATSRGIGTLRALAELLGIDVYGTTELIHAGHFDAGRFAADRALVSSTDDPTSTHPPLPALGSARAPRYLEVDALPSRQLAPGERARVATHDQSRMVLQLVARHAGVAMPGLLASRYCELAIPSTTGDGYHRIDVLLAGEYVRAFPDGHTAPGVVYPVRDPHALLQIADELRS